LTRAFRRVSVGFTGPHLVSVILWPQIGPGGVEPWPAFH
jgi:hypothetical protein